MTTDLPDLRPWELHEDHVGTLYRSLGFQVYRNINVDGKQVDMICTRDIPGIGLTKVYVDCKHTKRRKTSSVSNTAVDRFVNEFRSRKDKNGWSYGILLSNRPFSQYAQAAAKPHHDIHLKTIGDLEEELFQIRQYLHGVIRDTEDDAILADYVPLLVTDVAPALSHSRPHSLAQYVEDWLTDDKSPQLCILGDFGAGKTTFLRQLHYHMAKRYLAGKEFRMPCLLSLRDYYEAKDYTDLVRLYMTDELGASVPKNIFERFLMGGRFLFLLDGFDEMGPPSDQRTRHENYMKIAPLARGRSKTIVSCRPSYFVSSTELMEVFGLLREQAGIVSPYARGDKKITETSKNLTTHLAKKSQTSLVEDLIEAIGYVREKTVLKRLSLFTSSQIKAYIRKRLKIMASEGGRVADPEELFQLIQEIYDLKDLAARPILLKLIVQTLPSFRRDDEGNFRVIIGGKTKPFSEITPSVLYHVYTQGELEREFRKGPMKAVITGEKKKQFFGALAYEMSERGKLTIDHHSLESYVLKFLPTEKQNLEKVITELRTCSFLVRDRQEQFRFSHKSFLEYFAAMHLLPQLATKGIARTALEPTILPMEVLFFLGDALAASSPASIRVLRDIFVGLKQDSNQPSPIKHNIINILSHARHPYNTVEGVHIEGCIYQKQDFRRLSFSDSNLGDSCFRKCKIRQLHLNDCTSKSLMIDECNIGKILCSGGHLREIQFIKTTTGLSMSNVNLQGLQAEKSRFANGEVDSSLLVFGPWHDVSLKNVVFRKCLILSSDERKIESIRGDNLIFDHCVFLDVALGGGFCRIAKYRECVFVRCSVDSPQTLRRFRGSRGVFVAGEKQKEALAPNQPVLWRKDRFEKPSRSLSEVHGRNEEEKQKRRNDLLGNMSWEEILALGFPLTGRRLTGLSFKELWDKLERVHRDPSSLFS